MMALRIIAGIFVGEIALGFLAAIFTGGMKDFKNEWFLTFFWLNAFVLFILTGFLVIEIAQFAIYGNFNWDIAHA